MMKKDLADRAYDDWLASNKKERTLRERNTERRNANKGCVGWHFGIDEKPVYTRDKAEFKRELNRRNLMMRDDVRRNLK